jgi:hypothetical protein
MVEKKEGRKEGSKEICLLVSRKGTRKRERESVCLCVRVFVGPFIDAWARL